MIGWTLDMAAQESLLQFMCLPANWDGEGAKKPRADLIRTGFRLLSELIEAGVAPPEDIYPLPDGNIMLEWQRANGIILRIEIEEVGKGQVMKTFPDAPARFEPIFWRKD